MKAFRLTLSAGLLFAVDTYTSFFTSHIYWGVFGAQSRWTAAFIVILGGKTAGNVHYPGVSGKAFVIICYT
ncbi:hypothetical protein KQS06HV_90889 [Klebsiella quasipneumoniae subsp. similipneumoniae]|nr:hypothetical protein SB30_220180 [Klebsiella quasipneumoniae subsp. similipneumoniae]SAZ85174.1 hypothetical protein KQS06HV_90889 [Klebsiella quasipneumoniae subsp. similipneumoniae]